MKMMPNQYKKMLGKSVVRRSGAAKGMEGRVVDIEVCRTQNCPGCLTNHTSFSVECGPDITMRHWCFSIFSYGEEFMRSKEEV